MKRIALLSHIPLFTLATFAQIGSLDTSFGNQGKVLTTLSSDDAAQCMAEQADGKYLVAGKHLLRYNSDGSPDSSFGTHGIAQAYTMVVRDMELQSDGKIVLGGSIYDSSTSWDFAVMRYTSSGQIDTSFGIQGLATLHMRSNSIYPNVPNEINAISIQPSGHILVAGYEKHADTNAYNSFLGWPGWPSPPTIFKIGAIRRLSNSGEWDTAFHPSMLMPGGYPAYSSAYYFEDITDILLQPDGRFIVTGLKYYSSPYDSYLLQTLQIFGNTGEVDTTYHYQDYKSLGDVDDQRIRICQTEDLTIYTACNTFLGVQILAIDSSGNYDTSFNGVGFKYLTNHYSNLMVHSIALDSTDHLVIGGQLNSSFFWWRMDRTGAMDSACNSFSGTINMSDSVVYGRSMIIDGKGRLLMGGSTDGKIAVTRLHLNVFHQQVVACGQYQVGDQTYGTSGNYKDMLATECGADSVVHTQLTILPTSRDSMILTNCYSQTSPSGKYWTASGIYYDTLINHVGCDSIITVDLTILEPSFDSLRLVNCEMQSAPSGKVWTHSGVYYDTLVNHQGCDSFITVDLTILEPTSDSIRLENCVEQISPSGRIWTSSGRYLDTIPNNAGCDSIITVDLRILEPSLSELEVTSCFSYTSPSGQLWTASGSYIDHIQNKVGCDSAIAIDLTINKVDVGIVPLHQELVSKANGASYQWLDCERNFNLIPDATQQIFRPDENGSYAVEVSENGCVDTTECYAIGTLGIDEFHDGTVQVYPNPSLGDVSVDLGQLTSASLRIFDPSGRLIYQDDRLQGVITPSLNVPAGIYLFEIRSDGSLYHLRWIKN